MDRSLQNYGNNIPNNAKIQRKNWKMFKQIINVAKLQLYENLECFHEKIFLKDNFDIKMEEEDKNINLDKIKVQYEVERIKDVKKNQEKLKYFIKWKEYITDINL
jgi:ribosomal protein L14E/L6E/L27E